MCVARCFPILFLGVRLCLDDMRWEVLFSLHTNTFTIFVYRSSGIIKMDLSNDTTYSAKLAATCPI